MYGVFIVICCGMFLILQLLKVKPPINEINVVMLAKHMFWEIIIIIIIIVH